MTFSERLDMLTELGIIGENEREIKGFFHKYRWLSNFHMSAVRYNGHTYDSVEHAYQAAKAIDEESRAHIADSYSPSIAKSRGQAIKCRGDWEQVKLAVMEECLRSKFQDPILRSRLRATGAKYLEETNWWNDTFWGADIYGNGANNLGHLLMKIRGEISLEKNDVHEPDSNT